MPALVTPEAEPQQREPEASRAAGSEKAKQKETQTGGAQPPAVTQEQLQNMIEQQARAQQSKEVIPGAQEQAGQSIWGYCRDKVRGPMRTLLLAGAIAVSPVVAGTTYAGKKALDYSVGQVPVVRKTYEAPINILKKGAEFGADTLTAVVTSPALIPDTAVNIGQGLAGIRTKEAKGFVGRTWEHISEGIGGTLKWAKETGKWAGENSLNLIKGTLDTAVKALTGLVSIPYTVVNGAVKTSLSGLKGVAAGGVSGAVTSVATVALTGWAIWTYGLGNPAAAYWPWLQGIIKAAWTKIVP